METDPDFDNIEVSEYPENVTVEGTITEVVKGTQAELFDLDEDEEPRYGDRTDEQVQLTIEVIDNNTTYTVVESMTFYESPSNRSKFGKFIKRYGSPETGLTVTVDFDEDGNSKVVL